MLAISHVTFGITCCIRRCYPCCPF
uniref:Uncharacterized protein n=1 Tax=Anguilla anguilla TaxID=7936 RepID=A0A0E9QPN1_ANGAN